MLDHVTTHVQPDQAPGARAPRVGVLKAEGACGCSSDPDRKPPPISVPPQISTTGA